MKKYLESNTSLEDIKAAIRGIQKREDKRALYIFIAIVTAVLVAILIAVVYLLKNKMNDDEDFDEDWDTDWDDFDENDCCCTDKDVDTSVKVEKL
ncbi:MAG: hypothetical protein HFE57_13430 [Firmicutes bacterium]|jgi:hypothetical protein|nr:hypothetical protein [Bacillota bacterium]